MNDLLHRILVVAAIGCASLTYAAQPGRVLEAGYFHLGDDVVKDWPEAPAEPGGFELEIRFDAKANKGDNTLMITQRHVDNAWELSINKRRLADLEKCREPGVFHYSLPAGTLVDGTNVLRIVGRKTRDDITVGRFVLIEAPLREAFNLRPVVVTVRDRADGAHLPARITVTDELDSKVRLYYAERPDTAVRLGVIYSLGKPTTFELPPGRYRVHATHGMEWSLASASLEIVADASPRLDLELVREVDTRGFVAADTHIHTLTYSGHGDATVDERMVTLAGEGVELAIATDHNHQTDFGPAQKKLKLESRFTSVTGNEVTTKNGHFNSFPLPAGGRRPAHDETDWVKLVAGIREAGARVVILNHPRWPDIARGPFGKYGLNRASGDRASGGAFTFDAMELINSGTLQPDPLFLCRDWFALLNHGERVTAVGSSDSHTVNNIVGQGRTYVRSSTDDAAAIRVDEMCDNFLAGDTTISLGIFCDLKVNADARMGERVKVGDRDVALNLRVASPSWVKPRKALIYLNGLPVAERSIPDSKEGGPMDTRLDIVVPAPSSDAWLVCVVIGDAVTHPAWATEEKYTFAATNPVYLDADGDGRWMSPRETARARIQKAGPALDERWRAVAEADDSVAVQMLSELALKVGAAERQRLNDLIETASAERTVFREYLKYARP